MQQHQRALMQNQLNAGPRHKLPQIPDRMKPANEPSGRERMEIEIIKTLLASYFQIVKKHIQDLVPKTVMYHLVNSVKKDLGTPCVLV